MTSKQNLNTPFPQDLQLGNQVLPPTSIRSSADMVQRHSFLHCVGLELRCLEEIRMMLHRMVGKKSCSPCQLIERVQQDLVGPGEKLQP